MRVLVAGATGAIGQQLVPQLVAPGHQVTATTRSPAKAAGLRELGAEPAVVDGLDAMAVGEAVARAEPEVVIHQMTATGGRFDLRHFDRTFAATNELRTAGTDHLLAAATRRGRAPRHRPELHRLAEHPDRRPGEDRGRPARPGSAGGPAGDARGDQVPGAGGPARRRCEGIVLRYGSLYGPGASEAFVGMIASGGSPVIGDGAGDLVVPARARRRRGDRGGPGPRRARRLQRGGRRSGRSRMAAGAGAAVGAQPPLRVPVWLGRLAAGEVGGSMMTQIRGSSNAKAKRELGWQPAWPSWRDGFAGGQAAAEPARGGA